jgi:hypothetical protein
MGSITRILQAEALVLLIATVWIYHVLGASWWLFAVLLLFPDLFMVGYLKNSVVGAFVYNLGHTYVVPFVLLALIFAVQAPIPIVVPIIWIAHISMDRLLGYGLKLDTGFKDTHLGRIGG